MERRRLVISNFTGHPSVTLPCKLQPIGRFAKPKNLVITGHLFGEQTILELANAVETKLGIRIGNPPMNFQQKNEPEETESDS